MQLPPPPKSEFFLSPTLMSTHAKKKRDFNGLHARKKERKREKNGRLRSVYKQTTATLLPSASTVQHLTQPPSTTIIIKKGPKVRLFGVSAYLPPPFVPCFFGGGVVPLPFCLICSVPFLIDVFLSFLFKTSRWFASSFYSTHHFVLNLAAVGHSLKSGIR